MEYKNRKEHRIKWYDYSTSGGYFLTICAKEQKNYFWTKVGASIGRPYDFELSSYGLIVEQAINNIAGVYPMVSVDDYIIMPDHIHLLLVIHSEQNGRPMGAPTIDRVVNQTKGYITKRIGQSI